MLKTIHSDMYEVDKPIHKMLTHAKLYFVFSALFMHISAKKAMVLSYNIQQSYTRNVTLTPLEPAELC